MSGSYRSGKTIILARAAIRHCLVFPNARVGIFRAFLASLKRSTLVTVLEHIHPSWIEDWSNTDLVARFVNGSTISFIGADRPDKLGSIELSMALIDEASEVNEESLTMIQGRLSSPLTLPPNYEELPDNLREYATKTLDLRQTFLACNPKSTSHYLYDKFFVNPRPGHKVYLSNSIANVNLPKSYLTQNLSAYVKDGRSQDWVIQQIDLIRKGDADQNGLHLKEYLTPMGQRAFLGLWVALEGAIFNLDSSRHLLDKVPSDWVETAFIYCTVDYGFHNPRIAVIQEFRKNNLSHYAVIDYWAGEPDGSTGDDLIKALQSFDSKYHWVKTYFPHDQPGIYKLARNTFGASKLKRAKTNVFSGISTLASFFNSDRLILIKNKGHDLAWDELTGYEWKRGKDGEFLDEPVKKDDHFCLAPGTRVLTTNGYKDIENVKINERILTGDGSFKPVKMRAITSKKKIIRIETNSTYLMASESHPVYTEEGLKEIRDIKVGEKIWVMRRFDTGGSIIGDTQNLIDGQMPIISDVLMTRKGIQFIYTDKSIQTTMGLFLKDLKFTTKMKTRVTILLIIWKLLKNLITLKSTLGKGILKHWQRLKNWLRIGINQKKAENGIENTLKKYLRKIDLNLKSYLDALLVGQYLREIPMDRDPYTVTPTAKQLILETVENMEHLSESHCIEISVEGGNYLANGVLTSNCDSFRYFIYTRHYKDFVTGG